jgi:hypothetical protein
MIKRRNILIIACLAIVFFLTVSVASAGLLDFLFPPSKANPDDEVFEAIGGDDFLNVTLKGCLKVSEGNIPDASVQTGICGDIWYYDAKNVTYVDTEGNEGWFVVWKASPDKYDFFNYTGDINKYISDYLVDGSGKLFLEYSYENHNLYGVILGTGDIQYSEAGLIYDVLGLNRDGFDLIYTSTSPSYTSYSSAGGGGSHYHTVVGDRASVAYSDPGSYYDYYEYGDNYDIDDYLESEGYE